MTFIVVLRPPLNPFPEYVVLGSFIELGFNLVSRRFDMISFLIVSHCTGSYNFGNIPTFIPCRLSKRYSFSEHQTRNKCYNPQQG